MSLRIDPKSDFVRRHVGPGEGEIREMLDFLGYADMDDLVRTLASDDPSEVAHAREVLLNLGPDAVDALMRGLDGCSEVVGVEIIDLLRRATGEKLGANSVIIGTVSEYGKILTISIEAYNVFSGYREVHEQRPGRECSYLRCHKRTQNHPEPVSEFQRWA